MMVVLELALVSEDHVDAMDDHHQRDGNKDDANLHDEAVHRPPGADAIQAQHLDVEGQDSKQLHEGLEGFLPLHGEHANNAELLADCDQLANCNGAQQQRVTLCDSILRRDDVVCEDQRQNAKYDQGHKGSKVCASTLHTTAIGFWCHAIFTLTASDTFATRGARCPWETTTASFLLAMTTEDGQVATHNLLGKVARLHSHIVQAQANHAFCTRYALSRAVSTGTLVAPTLLNSGGCHYLRVIDIAINLNLCHGREEML
mmetsp:Transcript_18914/g.44139  ORF Transcript_18914/g.44139 Transcript_18914/m.44139 type:complete len:259 (-) Transcript_18914:3220-3996(-)